MMQASEAQARAASVGNPAAIQDRFGAFMKQVENAKTEQQYHHALEGLTNSENQDQRVAALNSLVALEISILGRFVNEAEMEKWQEKADGCDSFIPNPQLDSTKLPGVRAIYYIETTEGRRIEFLPEQFDSACEQARRNGAIICLDKMRKLHRRLRRELVRHKFIVDQLSVANEEERRAEQEVRTRRA